MTETSEERVETVPQNASEELDAWATKATRELYIFGLGAMSTGTALQFSPDERTQLAGRTATAVGMAFVLPYVAGERGREAAKKVRGKAEDILGKVNKSQDEQ